MATYDHIQRCFALTDHDVEVAVASRATTKSLLDHMAKVAKPNEGAPKILLLFARMATTACDWLDGELRVELVGDAQVCVIEAMTELGGGLRERALPPFSVSVPLGEFVRAVDRVPRMIEPLHVKSRSERRLVLVSSAERTGRSLPPPPVTIAEEHLIEVIRIPAAPAPAELRGTPPGAPPGPTRAAPQRPLPPRPNPRGSGK